MSSSYTNAERQAAVFLNKFPGIKKWIKKIYQRLNYLIHKKKYRLKTKHEIKAYEIHKQESFFGYYDKLPINPTGELIIFHSSMRSTQKLPSADKPLSIVVANFKTGKVLHKFATRAYNWQQGAKPMWISDNEFIFNDFDEKTKSYISKIVDAKNGIIKQKLTMPVYDYANKMILSLNYARLNLMRPDYGYRNLKNTKNIPPDKEGITAVNIKTGDTKLLYSIEQVSKIAHKKRSDMASHYFNHINFSPSGKQFVFLHRYILNGKRFDRLFLGDINGNTPLLLSDHNMVSHYAWRNETEIIAYMHRFDTGTKFYLLKTTNGEIKPLPDIINDTGDGHPHIANDKMLYDTYPNKARLKSLFLYEFASEKKEKIGEFFESFKFYGETRCDLHPRISPDGKYAFVDSVHTGKRKLYCITLKK